LEVFSRTLELQVCCTGTLCRYSATKCAAMVGPFCRNLHCNKGDSSFAVFAGSQSVAICGCSEIKITERRGQCCTFHKCTKCITLSLSLSFDRSFCNLCSTSLCLVSPYLYHCRLSGHLSEGYFSLSLSFSEISPYLDILKILEITT
jgi:hypothetical protein